MSATNRGAKRSEADFYPTPMSAFEPLYPYFRQMQYPPFIWEPACGDSRLVNGLISIGQKANGNDLKFGYNFLNDYESRSFILTNPPFSLAFEFCVHARKYSRETMLLLRLNFLASQKRRAWFQANEPSALFVLSERPDFTGGGGDACDYAWFYWGPRWKGIYHL